MESLLAGLAAHGPWRRLAGGRAGQLEATGGAGAPRPLVRLTGCERAVGWRFEGSAASLLVQAAMDRTAELLAALRASLAEGPGAGLALRLGLEAAGGGPHGGRRARPGEGGPRLELLLPPEPAEAAAGTPAGAVLLLRGWAQGGALLEGRRAEVLLVQARGTGDGEGPAAAALAAAADGWLARRVWIDFVLGSARRAPAHRSVR